MDHGEMTMKGLTCPLIFVINSNPSAKPVLVDLTDTYKRRANATRKNDGTLLIAHISSRDVTL